MPRLSAHLSPVLSSDVLQKLADQEIRTAEQFLSHRPLEVVKSCGIPIGDVQLIRQALLVKFLPAAVNGWQLYEDTLSSAAILSTGSERLDAVLDGGFYGQEVTELCGPPGSGKTQLCLSCCLRTILDTDHKVLFIDTSTAFCPSRFRELLDGARVTEEAKHRATGQLSCVRLFDVYQLMDFLESLQHQLASRDASTMSLKLIILDSITAIVAPIFGGKNFEGQLLVSKLAATLKGLAVQYSLTIVVTNGMVSGDNGPQPALGSGWVSVPHTRVLLQLFEADECREPRRLLTVMHSVRPARQPTQEFRILSNGVY